MKVAVLLVSSLLVIAAGVATGQSTTYVNIAWYDNVLECNIDPTNPMRKQSLVAGVCTWAGIGEKNADMYARADVKSDGTVTYLAGFTLSDCSDQPKRTSGHLAASSGSCSSPLFDNVYSPDSNVVMVTVTTSPSYPLTVPQGATSLYVNYVQYGFYHLDQCDGDPLVQFSGKALTCVSSGKSASRFVAYERDYSVVIREFKYPLCSQGFDSSVKVIRLSSSDLTGRCLSGRGVVASLTVKPLYADASATNGVQAADPTGASGAVAPLSYVSVAVASAVALLVLSW
eukprot:Opistho-2@54241